MDILNVNIADFLRDLERTDNHFGFSFANANNLNEATVRYVPAYDLQRFLPYIENFHIPYTKPTLAGVHYSKRSGLGITLRFPDEDFYLISPRLGLLVIKARGFFL